MEHKRSSWNPIRFGRKIRDLRESQHLTQLELADRVGVDRSYIGKIERGQRLNTLENIYRIARALGKSLSELFR